MGDLLNNPSKSDYELIAMVDVDGKELFTGIQLIPKEEVMNKEKVAFMNPNDGNSLI